MTGKWVSPNELFEEAKVIMLKGREPESEEDWARIVNFFAANISPTLAQAATSLMCKMYNVPLSEEYITKIVQFQLDHKEVRT